MHPKTNPTSNSYTANRLGLLIRTTTPINNQMVKQKNSLEYGAQNLCHF